tara:strand:- start:233 stop:1408 length:1176 start_codon:yes stop_codon:yes gene_type:complete
MEEFLELIKQHRKSLIADRRDFHMYPEVGYKEFRTSRIISEKLKALNIDVEVGVGQTGVVGLLTGEKVGPTVLLRFDMDALPIKEENTVEYVSQNNGVMHACGHDGHVAIGLCIARIFAPLSHKLKGTIKFVFQPAEEGGAGASAMIEDGVLLDPVPDYAYGMHLWNEKPVGWLGITDGAMMAGNSNWECDVIGDGGHAATPHHLNDPIITASQIVGSLQTVVARNISPIESVVMSVAQIHGGDTNNVIPNRVRLSGTLRYFNDELCVLVQNRMTTIVKNIAESMGCSANIRFVPGYKPVVNDAKHARLIRQIASETSIVDFVSDDIQTTVSEDFSEFLHQISGSYFFVGSANSELGLDYPHHHSRFDIDESALTVGVSVMSSIVSHHLLD